MSLPTAFDSRAQWGSICPSLNEIRDQGGCGSCWAVSSAEVMTDRFCIASSGAEKWEISAQDLVSCCGWTCGSGCGGGYPSAAFSYWASTGVVTGGAYNSSVGCYTYQIAPCEHHTTGSRPACTEVADTPACANTCSDGESWSSAKKFGASSYSVSSDADAIKSEIMTNGPVDAAFDVYEDFLTYKSGTYVHTTGSYLGGHAVKIIGWGTDSTGTSYWTVANSWNYDWGMNGFFNIAFGQCGIEGEIAAGLPKL